MPTVYAAAFKDGLFLMVYNKKRGGWEMPGGTVEAGESIEEGAKREFSEEAGFGIRILETMDLGYCSVCACVLLGKTEDEPEMASCLFSEIPENIVFDRSEYELVIPWARSVVDRFEKTE